MMKRRKLTAMAVAATMLVSTFALSGCGPKAPAETVTGEAQGYGGTITAEVGLTDGKIVSLTLTGADETPAIGGEALKTLQEAIVKAGTLEGVDGVTGATWTSNGVFAAINNAMGVETENGGEGGETEAVTATGLSHGLGVVSNGRLGPGKDDTGTGVYSFNQVFAYVLFDDAGKILDLQIDELEVATPNYDGDKMPHLTGFPGQSYNADLDHNETAETVLEQTDDTFLAEVDAWQTKRERGDSYKLSSGTWAGEMDIYEEFFKGKTVDELEAWYAAACSDLNGRPLHGASDKPEDVAKAEKLTDEQKADLDAISGATMSLNDPHGDIIGALKRAYENRKAVDAEKVAKVGLGVTTTGRVGPGKDDTGVSVYSFNTQIVGACYDDAGKALALYTDVIEVATPNYDGAEMPHLTGFPGQSYNADLDHNETAETVLEQTDDTFLAEVAGWQTKRERGDSYKLSSGTWAGEMDLFEKNFTGMTADEISEWFAAACSDLNGRPLHGKSDKPEDVAKAEKLTDEQKASLDAISGATMSLKDPHGDIIGAIAEAWANAKDTDITVA